MSSAPTLPLDVPPYQLQQLASDLVSGLTSPAPGRPAEPVQVRCAQALGSEIYVGCSNGELLRLALQVDDPNKLESYGVLSRQSLPNDKSVDEIVLIPCLYRVLVLSDRQVHFFTLPSLDVVPYTVMKPIRNVVTLAVDHQHLSRSPPLTSGPSIPSEAVEFCIIKRSSIVLYALHDRLTFRKEIPLPQGATLARRSGKSLCIADKELYYMVDLEGAQLFPLLPLSQAEDPSGYTGKPSITVIGANEFLILSWLGASTMGLFVTGEGDPVRGTIQWPSYPKSISLDYPFVTSLLSNDTIEIHDIETQSIVQVIGAPASLATSPRSSPTKVSPQPQRLALVSSLGGYLVPSTQRSEKMKMTPVRLLRS